MKLNFDALTKQHKKLLCSLYKTFLTRLKNADSIDYASYFEDAEELHNTLFPNLSIETISSLCFHLRSEGFLYCESGDDIAIDIELTPSSIAFMENRFKNNLKQLSAFILNIC